jgi:hypothetical protein
MNKRSVLVMAVVLAGLAGALAACGESTSTTTSVSKIPSTTVPAAPPTTVSTVASTTEETTAAVAGGFSTEDLRNLVLAEPDGTGLVPGLLYRSSYSGSAQLTDVRHWTLMPPERLQTLGFAGAWDNIFFTDDFYSKNGKAGTSLLTAALLFDTPQHAAAALQAFADTRGELWADWKPLGAVSGVNSIGQTGHLGSDNVTDVYPSTSFAIQVGDVCLLVGSQGGSESGQPLTEATLRSVAEKLTARAQARLAQVQE